MRWLLSCLWVWIMLFPGSEPVSAQYYIAGQDPASINWQRIDHPDFEIVFPESASFQAYQVANILEESYKRVSQTLDHKPKKITIVLHNQTVVSNGFVSPTPFRMELFTTPPQDNQPVPWLEHLVLHEMRHVVQIDKLDQGMTKVLSYLFGQQANGAVAGLMPMWYYEGDAVLAETALTKGGRGRNAAFKKEMRSLTLDSSQKLSFNKMLLGSYKDKTPDHYSLGYHLVSYARKKYGPYTWGNVENYLARNPYQLIAFNTGLKRETGIYSGGLYQDAMSYYDSLWNMQLAKSPTAASELIQSGEKNTYVSYRSPHLVKQDRVIALKKDFSHLSEFVEITPEHERSVFTPGILTSDRFSYANDKIVWSEREYDIRWDHRSYSVIKLYDLQKKSERRLTNNTRLFAPDLNQKGDRIVCVKVTRDNQYSLVILDSREGWIQDQFQAPQNHFLQNPVWSEDGRMIYVIGLTDKGKTIYQLNSRNGSWKKLFSPGYQDIQNLSPGKRVIFFQADKEQVSNIYRLNLKTGTEQRLTHSRFGATDVSYSALTNTLLYSAYQSDGYEIRELNLDEIDVSSSPPANRADPILQAIQKQEPDPIETSAIPSKEYPSEPYSKWENLFQFHSWAPFYFDYQDLSNEIVSAKPGVLLLSQNDLSTATSSMGYSYSDNRHRIHGRFTYSGWYPVIRLSSQYGGVPEVIKPRSRTDVPDVGNDYLRFTAEASLPLTLSVKKNITGFVPQIKYEYNRDLFFNTRENYYERGLKTLQYNVLFYSQRRMAYRDIFPKWGVRVQMNVLSSPFSEDILGNRFALKANLFLPGLVEDHGLQVTGGYQKQNPDIYLFSNYLVPPRGFQSLYTEHLRNLKVDYAFPLFYPDWSLGSLMYFKRFKADVFFDFALNRYRSLDDNNQVRWVEEDLYSYGTELTTDFHFARVMFPLTAGVRYTYQPQIGQHQFEALFQVDFYNIYNRFRNH